MAEQLPKVYDPKTVERQVNGLWLSNSYFHAEPSRKGPGRKAFTIVIPPPNVTKELHLGHALNNTLQDILIRFRRMEQYETLWMPGTDHAGIATQTVVEKRILAEEGKRRTDFQREEFVKRIQAWKDEYEATILGQLKAMGCSCDWQRTRFTMDEVCARAVRANFFKLFKDGLIYRGKRIVNWDPATQTVLADDEVEHETIQGFFWYLKYPLVEPVTLPRGEAVAAASADRGEGVPPLRPEGILPSDSADDIRQRQGHNLPHWTRSGATYAVTFRLADSLPPEVLHAWKQEREGILLRAKEQNRPLTPHEDRELDRLYTTRIEAFLDSGQGASTWPAIASVVSRALPAPRSDAWASCPTTFTIAAVGRQLPGILR
jgi:hypothetical protein